MLVRKSLHGSRQGPTNVTSATPLEIKELIESVTNQSRINEVDMKNNLEKIDNGYYVQLRCGATSALRNSMGMFTVRQRRVAVRALILLHVCNAVVDKAVIARQCR